MRKPIFMFIRYRALALVGLLSLLALVSYSLLPPLSLGVFGSLKQRVIVIDPGHGGIDGGANSSGFLEKDVNLAVAKKLKTQLQRSGAKVILTRSEDIALDKLSSQASTRQRRDLLSRINIIKKTEPDLFLSIHVNANPRRPTTTGPMVFYNRRLPLSLSLSEALQDNLNQTSKKNGFREHQPQPGNYYILKNSSYPGAIVELGFMTNYKEKQRLQQEDYQNQLAKAISRSIKIYFSRDKRLPMDKGTASILPVNGHESGFQVFFPQKNTDTLAAEPLDLSRRTMSNFSTKPNYIQTAVETLITGPENPDLVPVLNPRTQLLQVNINDGVATLNFSKELTTLDSGSYAEFLALNALTETVCQFPGIHALQILVGGEKRDTLGEHLDISQVITPEQPKIKVAIVIDDLAGGNQGLEQMLAMNKALTMAVMPKRESTRSSAETAYEQGCEVFLHLPMEPEKGKASWLGEGAITADMTPKQVSKQVQEDLADVPHAIGFNNHMGSKITKREDLMRAVLKVAKDNKLIVLDSRTTEDTVIPDLAREFDLPLLERSVFLDEINSVAHVRKQMEQLAEIAKQSGSAIAIGHVGITGKNTAAGLAEMIPWLEKQGIELVFASELVAREN